MRQEFKRRIRERNMRREVERMERKEISASENKQERLEMKRRMEESWDKLRWTTKYIDLNQERWQRELLLWKWVKWREVGKQAELLGIVLYWFPKFGKILGSKNVSILSYNLFLKMFVILDKAQVAKYKWWRSNSVCYAFALKINHQNHIWTPS